MAKIASATAAHLHPPGVGAMLGHQWRLGATSARARAMVGDMPGRAFVGRLWLAPALFLGRMARALLWLAAHRPRELVRFAAVSPLYVLALGSWTLGFCSQRTSGGLR
jgi:hypothetical protein